MHNSVKVCVVGAGQVGSTLAVALYNAGYQITGVSSRTLKSAKLLADKVGAVYTLSSHSVTNKADIVLLTTPDQQIPTVVADIASLRGFRSGQLVVHASGALPANVLEPALLSGATIVAMHPLQTFRGVASTLKKLPGCYYALEGPAAGKEKAKDLVRALEGLFFEIAPEDKALYHAAACVSSNYFVSIIYLAVEMLQECGLEASEAFKALTPLIETTWGNMQNIGPAAALTGPAVRGDKGTLSRHLSALQKQSKDSELVYRALGAYTMRMAEEQGLVKPERANAIIKLLKEGSA